MRIRPPRRTGLVLALVSIVVAAVGARAQDPVSLLPAGAHAVTLTEDLGGFWDRLASTRLYAAVTTLPSTREKAADLEQLRQFMKVFGPRAAVGFYGKRDGRADVIVVSNVVDPAIARVTLAAIESGVASDHGMTFQEEREGGVEIRVGRAPDGSEHIAWTLAHNQLLAATSRARLGAALELAGDRGAGSMAADPAWSAAARRMTSAAVVSWVDFEALHQGAPTPRQTFARSLTLGLRWVEAGLEGDAHLMVDEDAPSEFAAAMAAPSGPMRALGVAPETTLLLFSTASLDAGLLGTAIRHLVRTAAGADSMAADSSMGAGLARFEASTGIDVDEELVPALGREAALVVSGVDRGLMFPIPRIGILLEVRDEDRAWAVMEKLEGWASASLREKRSMSLAWQGEAHQGAAIRFAPTPLGERVEPTYAISEGFLFLGSSRDVVRTLLDVRADRAAALAEDPDFSTMRAFIPAQASGVTYLDIVGVVAVARELSSAYGWTVSPGGKPSAKRDPAAFLDLLENTPRLGMWSEPDPEEGIRWRALLEVR